MPFPFLAYLELVDVAIFFKKKSIVRLLHAKILFVGAHVLLSLTLLPFSHDKLNFRIILSQKFLNLTKFIEREHHDLGSLNNIRYVIKI